MCSVVWMYLSITSSSEGDDNQIIKALALSSRSRIFVAVHIKVTNERISFYFYFFGVFNHHVVVTL